MSKWSWKQAVADQVLALVNSNGSEIFSLEAIYQREAYFQRQFPKNQHVRAKIRQVLQQLRDDRFLVFDGGGDYHLNLEYEDLSVEFSNVAKNESKGILTKQVTRTVRLRNTLLAGNMKQRYCDRCQVCEETVQLFDRAYSEAHHIRPLGLPHLGQDIEGNILVLCPNHHVMFDRGAVLINLDTFTVSHCHDAFRPRPLHLQTWHALSAISLRYYCNHIQRL